VRQFSARGAGLLHWTLEGAS